MTRNKIDIFFGANIAIISLLVAFAYGTYQYTVKRDCFSCKNREIVNGTIEVYQYKRRGIGIYYRYEAKGKMFNGYSHNSFLCIYCDKIFVGKVFPVITCEKNSSLSEMLITRQDFNRYGIDFPDSLLWVDEYSEK